MEYRILPPAPDDSELARWADGGQRFEPNGSNIVSFVSPDERYTLTVELDDPVRGYLVRLYDNTREDDDRPISVTVIDEDELAIEVAATTAAAADDLAELADRPQLGPPKAYLEDAEDGSASAPEGWDDDEEWQDALEEAFEKADIRRSKGTLTTKTIDGRDYYYLQWREGDKVKSEYVAPVTPAGN
jgi:hypothetical protein